MDPQYPKSSKFYQTRNKNTTPNQQRGYTYPDNEYDYEEYDFEYNKNTNQSPSLNNALSNHSNSTSNSSHTKYYQRPQASWNTDTNPQHINSQSRTPSNQPSKPPVIDQQIYHSQSSDYQSIRNRKKKLFSYPTSDTDNYSQSVSNQTPVRVQSNPRNVTQSAQKLKRKTLPRRIDFEVNENMIDSKLIPTMIKRPMSTNTSDNSYYNGIAYGLSYKHMNNCYSLGLPGIFGVINGKGNNNTDEMNGRGRDLFNLGGIDFQLQTIHHSFVNPWCISWKNETMKELKIPEVYLQLKQKEMNAHDDEMGGSGSGKSYKSAVHWLKKYKIFTLFYIFYSMTNDRMQIMALKELYRRDWIYHKSLQIWLIRKAVENESSSAVAKNDNTYYFMNFVSVHEIQYFDRHSWSIRSFYEAFHFLDWDVAKYELLAEQEVNHFFKQSFESFKPRLVAENEVKYYKENL